MTPESAWSDFHRRMGLLGELITGPGYPEDARLRAEGYRYLTRLMQFALQWYVEFGDSEYPSFMRFGDDIMRWGAPNSDNNYLRARVNPDRVYRVTGSIAGMQEILLSIQAGDMALGDSDVLHELTLSDLDLDAGGNLELIVGGTKTGRNWMPLEQGADHLLVRQYITDWEHGDSADLRIEQIHRGGAELAPVITGEALADTLDRAATWVERSTGYWKDYFTAAQTFGTDNVLPSPRRPEGAAIHMLLSGGCWNLGPEQALLIECEAPQASYWSFQAYSPVWMETLDFANRVTSLNNHQARIDDDGQIRIVIAHRDPGVQNWIDTTGLTTGMMVFRFIRPTNAPVATTRVVGVTELRSELPANTPAFSAEQRATQITKRRTGVAHRFRH